MMCVSRRQAECMLECVFDEGTAEEVIACLYLGKWAQSHVLPPTASELKAAAEAEVKSKSHNEGGGLWRKATKAKFNTESLTDSELNIMGAVAIDVASRTLGMSNVQSQCCRRAILHSSDDKHRASVLECCLDKSYVQAGDSGMSKHVMKSVSRDFNAVQLESLIVESNLPEQVKLKGVAGIGDKLATDEDARARHLIDLFMALTTSSDNSEAKSSSGKKGAFIDRQHRKDVELVVNSVITFDIKRRKSILAAVHEAEHWYQLTEVFAAAIRGDGNKTVKRCASKEPPRNLFACDGGKIQNSQWGHYIESIKVRHFFLGHVYTQQRCAHIYSHIILHFLFTV